MFHRDRIALLIAIGAAGLGMLAYFISHRRSQSIRNLRDVWTVHRMVINKAYGNMILSNMQYIAHSTYCFITIDGNWLDAEMVFAVVLKGSEKSVQEAENMINRLIEVSPEMNTTILDIPPEKLNLVIGNLGETMLKICKKSGTKIYLKCDPALNAAKPFILEIHGPYDQNYYAYNLMRMLIDNDNSMFTCPNEWEVEPKTPPLELMNATQDSKYIEVSISSINSVFSFWIQLHRFSFTLDEMERRLADYYKSNGSTGQVVKPEVGMMIQVPHLQQEKCYRAKIVSVEKVQDEKNPYKAMAFFIDYGDCEVVDLQEIKLLPDDFFSYPSFAIECSLHGIVSVNLNSDGEPEWTDEALDYFESLVSETPSKILMARKFGEREIYVTENGQKMKKVIPTIDLVDTNQTEDVNVTAELISRGYARRMSEKKQESKAKNNSSTRINIQ